MTTPPNHNPAGAAGGDRGSRLFWGGAILSFLVPLVLYVQTMAASASFWDSGEFIAAAYRLGIPHSPGTPLYILVGRVFSVMPLGFLSVAERVNLSSAVCGAGGVLFVYLLIIRFMDVMFGKSQTAAETTLKVAGALVGCLFLTFSDTYWTNSIEAEVYAMSNALMGFMTWLALKWGDKPRDLKSTFLIYLLFYLLAMSVGFHLGTILAFSGIFLFILMTQEKPFSNVEFLIACFGVGIFIADATLYRNGQVTVFLLVVFAVVVGLSYSRKSPFAAVCSVLFVLGLTVHFYLLIRSGHNPSLDEGNPETWRDLYASLRREQYPPMNIFERKASFWFQLQHFNGYFQSQFQMASAYVQKLNMGSIVPIGLGIWGMVDQFSKHRRTFVMLFFTFVITSFGLIMFLNFSDAEVRERDYFYSPAFYYFAVYIGVGAASLLVEVRGFLSRRSASLSPAAYGVAVVFLVLPVFTLEHHYFTHDRSNDYTCPVYARNMLVGLEPDAIIFTNGDNDTFPLWYIQEVEGYRTDVRVVNLSLLNTPWYIEQCRDNEPRVPIAWTDEQIERLTPVPVKNGWLLVRDLAVQHILQTNRFQRPVYFAVTIPPATYAPYRKYMEMEGLVYKVVPREGDNMINVTRLEKNVWESFKYDGILTADWQRDRSLHLPTHTEHLIQNYAAAFVQLAYIQHQDSAYADAQRSMAVAGQISPNMEPPRQLLGLYYLDAGDTASAIGYYLDRLRAQPGDIQLMYRLGGVYERIGEYEKSLDLLDAILADDPEDRDLTVTAHSIALKGGLLDRARRYLSVWLSAHPSDTSAQKMLEELDARIRATPEKAQ
jgi:hypothetical protein